uniref:NADH-ubiquinone oxidoreductase chain 6 n=1 Tax=Nimbapanchax leucopterygius TaxID=696753 RepID=A0A518LR23_9TELE|nr:NADH dehydrogenase subunit 6 [Nimbapanchax leucopterygius]QDV92504.1 NADH dehydrogenase subunit 6 [Nimbapanchax leucopterygius]
MMYVIYLCFIGLVFGLAAVASNPSPYFAAFGLVVVSAAGCGILASYGASFLSLILFLIYLGGMLVVFAYSAALAAEPYPEGWGSNAIFGSAIFYVFLVMVMGFVTWDDWYLEMLENLGGAGEIYVLGGDSSGVGLIYSCGGWLLVLGGLVLLVTLFVVLEITRGLARGVVRVV